MRWAGGPWSPVESDEGDTLQPAAEVPLVLRIVFPFTLALGQVLFSPQKDF